MYDDDDDDYEYGGGGGEEMLPCFDALKRMAVMYEAPTAEETFRRKLDDIAEVYGIVLDGRKKELLVHASAVVDTAYQRMRNPTMYVTGLAVLNDQLTDIVPGRLEELAESTSLPKEAIIRYARFWMSMR